MDWPARSTDLNPIEHVWDALGRAIATRNLPPRTIQEMKTALLNEWDQLPQEMINCLISSMKSRCKACISVRGDHTPVNPFFCLFCNRCFIASDFNECYARSCA
ncbi:hypothetical protein AVEN_122095-1 [Araneus ventricosus]|uniref:Tc1-like transposase DDE domain-containing protein n=1 Tax=Araneus ventricosus TaxID=182803 RepID=A0A4Y2S3A9_ARAVE|nr:hypothetical protein AVEN_122095-1 [Araneus ventricosus]